MGAYPARVADPGGRGLAAAGGEHCLSFAATEAERQSSLARWVLTGLEGGERFVYADPDEDCPSRSLHTLLVSQQFDADAASQDGRLVRMPVEDFYSSRSPARITATAQSDGSAAVRVATRASAAMVHLGPEQLLAFEGELAKACRTRTFSALCQYDPLSAGEWLSEVSSLHQLSGGSTPYFAVPGKGTVMLFGEVDFTNSDEMARSLREATRAANGRLLVDLDGVQLMSAAGCRAILEGTDEFRARGGEVVLLAQRPLVGRVLHLMRLGSVRGVTITGAMS